MSRSPVVAVAVSANRLLVLSANSSVKLWAINNVEDAVLALRTGLGQEKVSRKGRFARRQRVHWVLLPPLTALRPIELPPLKPSEISTILTRHVTRYFPTNEARQIVVWQAVQSGRSAPNRILACVAPEEWVVPLREAFVESGIAPADPTPAHEAWARAAREMTGPVPRAAVVVAMQSQVVVLSVGNGRVADSRLFPASASKQAVERAIEFAGSEPVVLLGGGHLRDALASRLDSSHPDQRVISGDRSDAIAVAGKCADGGQLALVPASEMRARRSQTKKRVRVAYGLILVLILVSAMVEYWGTRREIRSVGGQREAIQEQVVAASLLRNQLRRLDRTVITIDSLERTAPPFAGMIVELTRHLPEGVSLTALRAKPDTIALEGSAADVSQAIAPLNDVTWLHGLASQAPVVRQRAAGRLAEQFSMAGRVVMPGVKP